MPPAVFQSFTSIVEWLMAEAMLSWCQEEGTEVQIHKAFRHPTPSLQLFGELCTWPSVRATEKSTSSEKTQGHAN